MTERNRPALARHHLGQSTLRSRDRCLGCQVPTRDRQWPCTDGGGLATSARVGTRWWRMNVVGSAAVVFLPGRPRFDDGKDSAPFDAAIVLWGVSVKSS